MVDKIISVFIMIVIVAILSVVLAPNSQASKIVAGIFAGFANSLKAAKS